MDQLRADHLGRLADRFLPPDTDGAPGGFRWLIDDGAYWPYARHDVFQAMTGPGHSSIATGAWPARSGIALNHWWSPETAADMYCVHDPSAEPLPNDGKGKGKPIGLRHLRAPTLGDTLKNSGVGGTVASIALKDRAAALMAGFRADAVLWFDSRASRWASSSFWWDALPDWVAPLNKAVATRLGGASDFESLVTHGNQMTVDAALATVDGLDMGRDASPDLLLVGFSLVDYVGHREGPLGEGLERTILDTDAAIARLLAGLSERLGGLDDVLVGLTADHGIAPLPEDAAGANLRAGRIGETTLTTDLNAHLTATIGESPTGRWVTHAVDLNLWFDSDAIAQDAELRHRAEEATRSYLLSLPAIEVVFTRSDAEAGLWPPGEIGRRLANQYVVGRSGDVLAGPLPFYFAGKETSGAGHMSRFNYDTRVPIVLRGAGVTPGRYARSADVIDLAPTLSFLLDILPPAAAEGRVLHEGLGPLPAHPPPSEPREKKKRVR